MVGEKLTAMIVLYRIEEPMEIEKFPRVHIKKNISKDKKRLENCGC